FGRVGIGTSSPFATLSIQSPAGTTQTAFAIGSSTATSFIVDANGDVGIGTATPDVLLTLKTPTGSPVQTPALRIYAANGVRYTDLYHYTDDDFVIKTSAGGIAFQPNNGIVSNTRTEEGTGFRSYRFQGANSNSYIDFFRGGTNQGLRLYQGTDLATAGATVYLFDDKDTDGRLTAASGNQNWMSLEPTIAQSGTAGYTVLNIDSTQTSVGSGSNYLINAQVGGSSKLAVLSSGNVGIGTTTPGQKLSVAGDILGNNFISSYFTSTSTTATSTLAGVFSVGSTTPASNSLLSVGTSSPLLFVDKSSGNVGIGTAGPGTALHVGGSGALSFGATPATTGTIRLPAGSSIMYRDAANTQDLTALSMASDYMIVGGSGALQFAYNGAVTAVFAGGSFYPEANTSIGDTGHRWTKLVLGSSSFSGNLTLIDVQNYSLTGSNASSLASLSGTLNTTGVVDVYKLAITDTAHGAGSNLLALYSGASGTTGRFVVDMSGNVGIGTTTPNWLLQVAGTRPSFALSDTSASANLKHWLFSSMGGNLYVGTSTDAYATSTPAALTISNSGNVGIGTAGPETALQVKKDITSGTVGANQIISGGSLNQNVNGSGVVTAYTGTDDGFTYGAVGGYASIDVVNNRGLGLWGISENSPASQVTYGSPDVFITQSGNVGIGTTSPATTLSVQGNALFSGNLTVANITATGTTLTLSGLPINSLLSTNASGVLTGTSTPTFGNFNATSTTATSTITGGLAIETSGLVYDFSSNNVGIGTAAPGAKLHLYNSSGGTNQYIENASTEAAATRYIINNAPTTPLYVGVDSTSGGTLALGTSASAGVIHRAGAFPLQFATNNAVAMTILSGGNVGIGTTSPGTLLSLGNTGANTINISATATSTFGSGLNVLTGCLAVNGTCVGGLPTGTDGQMLSYVGATLTATSSIFLATSGNIGVGTTSPWGNLSVEMNTTNPSFVVSNQGSSTPAFFIGGVNQNGNIGVGTTSPAEQLAVANRLYVGGTGTSTIENNLRILGTLQVGAGTSYLTTNTLNLGSGGDLQINGTSVLNATTLGSGVTGSSLTSVGTITSGTWTGATIAVANGGTGATTLTGVLKGNGTSAFTAAANGTDYTLITGTTCSAGQHVSAITASGGVTCSADTDTVVRFASIQTFTSGTDATYTTPANTSYIVVELWGNGGGAGGQGGGSGLGTGGGGGGGGYSMKSIATPAATYKYTSGGGGAGGSGGNNGTDGVKLCFGTNATACTTPLLQATGGAGGSAGNGEGGTGTPGAGGSGSSGDVNLKGNGGSSNIGGIAAGDNIGGRGGDGVTSGAGGAGTAGSIIVYEYKTVTSGADLAENYSVSDSSVSAGEIVSFDFEKPLFVKRAVRGDHRPLAGIISTQPGLLLTDKTDATGQRPVALAGRVPTKVNLEGGEIAIGDRIALSSVPGVGMKAGLFDASVGIALEPHTAASIGETILVFMNLQQGVNISALAEELFSATTTTPHLTLSSSGAEDSPALTFSGDISTGIWSLTSSMLNISTGGRERLRIDSLGNVGIGIGSATSSVSVPARLTVVGAAFSTDPLFAVFAGATSTGATTTAFVIDYTGNVGIGTTNPDPKLEVAGAGCFDTAVDTHCTAVGTAGDIYYGTAHANWTDIAEKYPSLEALESGDIISLDAGAIATATSAKPFIKKAAAGETLLGAISTQPGMVLGDDYGKSPDFSVALVGRVPVKVSTESGPIAIGNRITSSSLAGVGMKATTSGMTVGIALESFDESTTGSPTSNAAEVGLPDGRTVRTGKILVFVNLGYSKLDDAVPQLAAANSSSLATNGWSVDQSTGKVNVNFYGDVNLGGNALLGVGQIVSQNGLWKIDETGRMTMKYIEAEEINAQKIIVQNIQVKAADITQTGITIYDRATQHPVCVFSDNNVLHSEPGDCASGMSLAAPIPITSTATPIIDITGLTASTTSATTPTPEGVGAPTASVGTDTATTTPSMATTTTVTAAVSTATASTTPSI
ncbi:MAG: hypothetical protein HYT39_00095, partial [Candidatus Sungbacteria bacterium]|nr:hypothetical protein [Candidatus Sungbacteria bacterium]